MLDCIKRFFGFFDSNGLRYRVQYLNSIKNICPYMQRIDQARFVDIVTKKDIDKSSFEQHILNNDPDRWFLSGWNTTSVGNMAYVSIESLSKKVREHADLCLENLRTYCINNRVGQQ